MDTSRFDSLYGGKPGAAGKALAAMRQTYGPGRGEQVFAAKARVSAAERRGGLVASVRAERARVRKLS